jgi:hypothetical protein
MSQSVAPLFASRLARLQQLRATLQPPSSGNVARHGQARTRAHTRVRCWRRRPQTRIAHSTRRSLATRTGAISMSRAELRAAFAASTAPQSPSRGANGAAAAGGGTVKRRRDASTRHCAVRRRARCIADAVSFLVCTRRASVCPGFGSHRAPRTAHRACARARVGASSPGAGGRKTRSFCEGAIGHVTGKVLRRYNTRAKNSTRCAPPVGVCGAACASSARRDARRRGFRVPAPRAAQLRARACCGSSHTPPPRTDAVSAARSAARDGAPRGAVHRRVGVQRVRAACCAPCACARRFAPVERLTRASGANPNARMPLQRLLAHSASPRLTRCTRAARARVPRPGAARRACRMRCTTQRTCTTRSSSASASSRCC